LEDGRRALADSGVPEAYQRLPEELQDVWDRVEAVDPDPRDCGEEARDKRRHRRALDVEIGKLGRTQRQQLFLFALLACDFSASAACHRTAITPREVGKWMMDKGFVELRQQVQEAKKDLIESSLIGLVKQGDPSATIFASKTLLRDRGYSEKTTLVMDETPGKTLEQLNLTLEERLILLAKVREATAKALPAPALDVEFEVKDG
jgi:hypothetical protein